MQSGSMSMEEMLKKIMADQATCMKDQLHVKFIIMPTKEIKSYGALSCGEEQDNFVWPIEVPLTGKICLPKSRWNVETVRKCQLVIMPTITRR
ncbi:hypothetical protein H5410_035734 [Solanum commersonii]|uniref:Uncharacterized protein n=1 Tax=Solanum commersonii TaxID=4109 RepID=A0A9J5Y620_SOLCO|nr:hypothetical protein H5410_035734 [Solanum commersonii]